MRSVELQIDGRSAQWTVVGVVDAGPQALAYVPQSTLDRYFDDTRVDAAPGSA